MLVVFNQNQPTVIKQSSVVNYLMQSVTSTMLLLILISKDPKGYHANVQIIN